VIDRQGIEELTRAMLIFNNKQLVDHIFMLVSNNHVRIARARACSQIGHLLT